MDRLIEGENPLRLWREYRRMTQGELAAKVKVTVAHISQLESANGNVR